MKKEIKLPENNESQDLKTWVNPELTDLSIAETSSGSFGGVENGLTFSA